MLIRLIAGVGALLIVFGGTSTSAQSPADAYFHEAAQHYIADDVSTARQVVERGLEVVPSDPRLLSLRKKLEEAGRSEGGDSSQEQSRSGQQGARSDNGGTDAQSGETSQEGGSRSGTSGQPGDPSRQQEESSPSVLSDGEGSEREAGGQRGGANPGGTTSLSRTQAERLLQALEGQEKKLLREVQARSSESRTVEKDW